MSDQAQARIQLPEISADGALLLCEIVGNPQLTIRSRAARALVEIQDALAPVAERVGEIMQAKAEAEAKAKEAKKPRAVRRRKPTAEPKPARKHKS